VILAAKKENKQKISVPNWSYLGNLGEEEEA